MSEQKFEKMDWYRNNEAFSEYTSHWDNKDGVVQEQELVRYVCKMPLESAARRELIKNIKSPLE